MDCLRSHAGAVFTRPVYVLKDLPSVRRIPISSEGENLMISRKIFAPLAAACLAALLCLPALAQSHHDVSAGGLGAALVQVLFPKLPAFLYAPY